MTEPARRAKILRDLQQDFIPIAMHRACRRGTNAWLTPGRIERSLGKIVAALKSVVSKA